MKPNYTILLWLLLVAFSFESVAQGIRSLSNRRFLFTGGTGFSTYFGELKSDNDRFDTKLNITFGLHYRIQSRYMVGMNILWYALEGDDAEGPNPKRNLSFTSSNFEWNAMGTVLLFPDGSRFNQRKIINFFVKAGFGFTWFNPKGDLSGTKHALRPLLTEGVEYNRFTTIFPVGMGIKLRVSNFANIVIDGGYRFAFTDYFDDVSTVYIDQSAFTDPTAALLADRGPELGEELRPAGAKRGNPGFNDAYFILNLRAEYYLPATFNPFQINKLRTHRRKQYYRKRPKRR